MAKNGKKTYGQKWHEYNAAQVAEKRKFQRLLHELCQAVIDPPQPLGRPRLRVSDMLFCMALKVYTKFPARRSMSDLEVAYDRGFISRIPGYNTILNYFGMKDLTPYLDQLITESSLPLKAVERDFAVDSSGFSTSNFGRYVDLRFGKADVIDRRNCALMFCKGALLNDPNGILKNPGRIRRQLARFGSPMFEK